MNTSRTLSAKAIAEFKYLCREEFGQDLSDGAAAEAGLNLLAVLKQLLESSSVLDSKASVHRRPS